MGRICVVVACGSEYYPDCGLYFHRFPKGPNVSLTHNAKLVTMKHIRNKLVTIFLHNGFRPARSTTTNLLGAMAYVIPHVDAGVQVDAAYFDFKKAFDLVDNDILLSKLAGIGCTNQMLNLFASYMRERKQYVEYDGCRSEQYQYQSKPRFKSWTPP